MSIVPSSLYFVNIHRQFPSTCLIYIHWRWVSAQHTKNTNIVIIPRIPSQYMWTDSVQIRYIVIIPRIPSQYMWTDSVQIRYAIITMSFISKTRHIQLILRKRQSPSSGPETAMHWQPSRIRTVSMSCQIMPDPVSTPKIGNAREPSHCPVPVISQYIRNIKRPHSGQRNFPLPSQSRPNSVNTQRDLKSEMLANRPNVSYPSLPSISVTKYESIPVTNFRYRLSPV